MEPILGRLVMPERILFTLAFALICANSTGCVSRRITIQSDPPGALAYMDGEELGYTPVSTDITYYGPRELTLVKDNYQTLTVLQKVRTPWYQVPPLDFISDNLLPFRITDRNNFYYRLQKREGVRTNDLIDNANRLRDDARFGP